MNVTLVTVMVLLFGLLGSGVWIAMSLIATAGISMQLLTSMPVAKIWAQAMWNSLNSWSLAALPMFIFLGEMILRTRMSDLLFEGLRPFVQIIPGRLLHINILGSAIFAAVSGSSPATAATIGKITLHQLKEDGYDTQLSHGSLAGAGTLGLLIPPSIVLIIYGGAGRRVHRPIVHGRCDSGVDGRRALHELRHRPGLAQPANWPRSKGENSISRPNSWRWSNCCRCRH